MNTPLWHFRVQRRQITCVLFSLFFIFHKKMPMAFDSALGHKEMYFGVLTVYSHEQPGVCGLFLGRGRVLLDGIGTIVPILLD